MRKQTKIAAMVSAAALLAIGASVTSLAAWSYDESIGEYVYKDKDGDPEEGWHRYTNGAWCFADEDGVMVRNHLVGEDTVDDLSGKIYYVGEYASREKEMWVPVPNEDEIPVGTKDEEDIIPEFLYYYISSAQYAYKADANATIAKSGVWTTKDKQSKGIFLFNDEGYMLLGEQGDYYCVTLDDLYDNLIEVEGETGSVKIADSGKYVEGQALTGWAKFPSDDPDKDGTWYYFGTDGKKVSGVKAVKWLNATHYYKFDAGKLVTTVPYVGKASIPDADHPGDDVLVDVGIYSYSTDEGLVNGNSWYYDTANDKWYYIVNLRDSDRNVTRGVIFNAQDANKDGKINSDDNKVAGTKRAKLIDGAIFIFGADGAMLTGDVELEGNDCQDTTWNGITCKQLTKGSVYYCNPKKDSGHRGEVTEGQFSYDVGDEEVTSYFGDEGIIKNAMVKGYVYDKDGYLVVSTEDDYTAFYTGDGEEDFRVFVKSGKGVKETTESKTLAATLKDQTIYVSRKGTAKEDGKNISVDGNDDTITVKDYLKAKQ